MNGSWRAREQVPEIQVSVFFYHRRHLRLRPRSIEAEASVFDGGKDHPMLLHRHAQEKVDDRIGAYHVVPQPSSETSDRAVFSSHIYSGPTSESQSVAGDGRSGIDAVDDLMASLFGNPTRQVFTCPPVHQEEVKTGDLPRRLSITVDRAMQLQDPPIETNISPLSPSCWYVTFAWPDAIAAETVACYL